MVEKRGIRGSPVLQQAAKLSDRNGSVENFRHRRFSSGGRISLFDESSVTTVFEPTRKFQTLAVNKLND